LPAHRFRLQGLTTLLTAFSSANLANHISGRQRSWAFPFEAFSSRRVSRHSCRADPHAVGFLRRLPIRRIGSAQKDLGSWALLPLRVPCGRSERLGPVTAGGSLGLYPSRGLLPHDCCGFRRKSSYVLGDSTDGGHPKRLHLRVSITVQLACSSVPERTPSRVCAPFRHPEC
jgi:hypothetical protein